VVLELPITPADLDDRTLTGADGTTLDVTDCRSKDQTVKRGTICAAAAFPGRGGPDPGVAWGVTVVR
jgi:hypothetical protein